jgi:alpha-N-arabinofuranosidase
MPIGADEFVTMNTDRPYVGEHTPMVNLSSSEAHGIQQAGLAVRKGKSYAGRVVLAGTPGTTVQVSLIWGNAATDRQTVVINKVGPEYRKFPLTFRVEGDRDLRLLGQARVHFMSEPSR